MLEFFLITCCIKVEALNICKTIHFYLFSFHLFIRIFAFNLLNRTISLYDICRICNGKCSQLQFKLVLHVLH